MGKVVWWPFLVQLCRQYCVACYYSELQTNIRSDPCSLHASRPQCKTHSRPCVLRVVRKDGENKGRQFYACSLPRGAQCGFFEVCVKISMLTVVHSESFVYCNVTDLSVCSFTYFIYVFAHSFIYLLIYLFEARSSQVMGFQFHTTVPGFTFPF